MNPRSSKATRRPRLRLGAWAGLGAFALAWLAPSIVAAQVAGQSPPVQVRQVAGGSPPPPIVAEAANETVKAPWAPVPPLSLPESSRALDQIARRLKAAEADKPHPHASALDQWLVMISRYVRRVDNANPTLPFYQWHRVASGQAGEGGVETDAYTPLRPVPHVNGVGFTVTRGDIFVESIEVHAADGTVFSFTLNQAVAGDTGARRVCLIDTEITLTNVVMRYRQLRTTSYKNPRVKVDAGISSVPEKAKESIYQMALARKELAGGDSAAAELRVRKAIEALAAYQPRRR